MPSATSDMTAIGLAIVIAIGVTILILAGVIIYELLCLPHRIYRALVRAYIHITEKLP